MKGIYGAHSTLAIGGVLCSASTAVVPFATFTKPENVMCNLMTTLRNIMTILTIGATCQLFGQTAARDTIFIFKDTVDGELQTIFIDNNTYSKFYERISHFSFQYFDQASYKISTDYFKEETLTLTKSTPIIPWTNWVTLKQFKGQFYAYHPCDFLFHFRQSVNDTTFIDWTGEGPVANKIIEQKKIDSKTYEFKLTGIYEQDRKIIIHIIDFNKGVAVFEQITYGIDKSFCLMIAADKIKSVPIIVNHCPTQKQTELQFDEIDFTTLLTTK